MLSPQTEPHRWQDALYAQLRAADVSIFSYVPDAGHRILIERAIADTSVHAVPLSIEHEGVSLQAGAHLGGKRSVLLMQSSGVGNCINMLSLIQHARFPFLTLVTMRGEFGEGNPWQFAMGRAVAPTLAAMDVQCLWARSESEVTPTVAAALTMAYKSEQAVAVLLSQQLLGAKSF